MSKKDDTDSYCEPTCTTEEILALHLIEKCSDGNRIGSICKSRNRGL